mmetsp:Transcript_51926/g.161528  ORF Transcript_51926/g.161528 Transcript_51926/m.161528 type:complete len:185 (-) Transcript_51926:588-1142(-)
MNAMKGREKSINSVRLKSMSRRSSGPQRAHSMEEDLDAILTGLQLCPEVVADAIRQKSRETSKESSHLSSFPDENSSPQQFSNKKADTKEGQALEKEKSNPFKDETSSWKQSTNAKLLDLMASYDQGQSKSTKRKDSDLKPCKVCKFLFFQDKNDGQEGVCTACRLKEKTATMVLCLLCDFAPC